jgi:hypothetical protein
MWEERFIYGEIEQNTVEATTITTTLFLYRKGRKHSRKKASYFKNILTNIYPCRTPADD